jgi:cystathionine gamma-synthase
LLVAQIYYPKYNLKDEYLQFATNRANPGYGGLFSIVLHTHQDAQTFYDLLPIHKGPSLGTNFTLACPYTLLAHYKELDWAAQFGVSPFLIRVSVGTEPIDWLVASFLESLEKV